MTPLKQKLTIQLLRTSAASFHAYGCDDCDVFADWPAEDAVALLAEYRAATGDESETPTPAAWMMYLAGQVESK
jgi:hypothetical protein